MSETLACPWCGFAFGDDPRIRRKGIVADDHDHSLCMVMCRNPNCYACGPRRKTPESAIAAWNRVAANPRLSVVAALRAENEAMREVCEAAEWMEEAHRDDYYTGIPLNRHEINAESEALKTKGKARSDLLAALAKWQEVRR